MGGGVVLYAHTPVFLEGSSLITSGSPTDGPVLSQTDLYLLNTELQINPILANSHATFHLVFNLQTGMYSYLVLGEDGSMLYRSYWWF